MLSSTVTTAVFEATFPLTSVTVKITVFGPTFVQLKAVVSKTYVAIAQLSNEPLSICAGVIVACPLASNCTVIFCVRTVGLILSSTVTTAVFEAAFP
ncbi:hypothetical protein D9M72_399210 [compost metagenome]